MSCSCNSNPCKCNSSKEPLSSALNNFITTFFGTLTKSCVNNVVVWTLPCDLEAGNPSFPRNPGEGLACYFSRFIQSFISAQQFSVGSKGYETRNITGGTQTLTRSLDVVNQDFTGTLSSDDQIDFSHSGAENGDEFFLSFTNLDLNGNDLEITSDGATLLVIDTDGTLNGFFKVVYTGTIWKLTLTSQNLS